MKDKDRKWFFYEELKNDKSLKITRKSGGSPNAEKLAEYHGRVRTVKGRKDRVDPVFNNTFTKAIPATRNLVAYDPETKETTPSPRRLALDKRNNLLESEKYQKTNFYSVHRVSHHTLKLYFRQEQFWFVKEYPDGRIKESFTYGSRETAMLAYEKTNIMWHKTHEPGEQPEFMKKPEKAKKWIIKHVQKGMVADIIDKGLVIGLPVYVNKRNTSPITFDTAHEAKQFLATISDRLRKGHVVMSMD